MQKVEYSSQRQQMFHVSRSTVRPNKLNDVEAETSPTFGPEEKNQDTNRNTEKHLPIIWAYKVDFTVVQTELEPHIYLGF